ncbi:MAG: hypothetical protein ACQEQG_04930 [Bacillota bacterium]
MLEQKESYELRYTYEKDRKKDAYVIEIDLDDYSQLFNGWDASPLEKKELNPDLLDYLEGAAYEIPLKEDVELWFYLPEEIKNEQKEAKSKAGVKNNFRTLLHFINKTLNKTYRKIFTYIVMGLLFMVSAYIVPEFTDLGLVFSLLIEGLFIGGWVFLWEAFSLFFFSGHEIRQRRKGILRFLKTEIEIKYYEA